MITGTAPIRPVSVREDGEEAGTLSEYRDREALAGSVVWDLLTHDPRLGADIARVLGMELPDGADSEDMYAFVYELVTDAAECGYRLAGISLDPFDPEIATATDVSRMLSAVLHRRTIEDDQAFDPEYNVKLTAARDVAAEKAGTAA